MPDIAIWGQPAVRVPEHDFQPGENRGETEAWRYTTPCDDSCHHPVHAFDEPRGARHLGWFAPGQAPIDTEVDS